ncbi:DUF4265 domain-containing protein [Pseudomonas cichorii]|uniref:DUF4265 domain-containing protein n=1 Tax=Pseudomonas cichorii TaxID=36746 RepID=UPI0018E65720|nr:DUF4265 domain-containing protein [Pseudomonas cichorii]MBI6851333.1 DUF4265 domain-containing protein [Pseudomonas cichorii]
MSSSHMTDIFHKIVFELTPDEDDYPPVSAESLWGIYQKENTYIIDNTPYYIYGVSKGDSVYVKPDGKELIATQVLRQGGHSTIRVYANTPESKSAIIDKLQQFGASCLSNKELSLFSVDIPETCDFAAIDNYLSSLSDGENIAYEDACLQHPGLSPSRLEECLSLATIPFMTH